MDNKKFEQLIDLIINEDEDKARALFHDIVVEKSREIYESIMDEEMMGDMDEGMGGQVGDLLDEINAEEMSEEEDPMMDMDDEEIVDIEADDTEAGEGAGEVEDAVVRIEDKLDQLMAEFEQIMGGDEEGDEDFGDEEGEEDFGDEEGEEEDMMEAEDDLEEAEDMEEEVMEAITLKKVSVTHGDNGAYTKSPSLHDPKVKAAGVNPVKFSGASEAVPTSPKGPSNAYSKGETQVKGAGSFKNAPAQASQDLEKAPAPKKGDNGQNTKSPLGESRKIVKKRV
jgi:hypothetical protein